MLQHLVNYIDVTAGCIVCILELHHIGQLLVGGYPDYLLSGGIDGLYRALLILVDGSEHITRIGDLPHQIIIVVDKAGLLLHIGVQGVFFFHESVLQRLRRSLILGSEDKATAEALKNAFMEEEYTLNPNVKKKSSFIDYYDDLVGQIANSGYVFRTIYENQEGTVESIDAAREQVIGVSSDEELSNMVKFQNAYNASSRYINVIDEMLEHLLSSLA